MWKTWKAFSRVSISFVCSGLLFCTVGTWWAPLKKDSFPIEGVYFKEKKTQQFILSGDYTLNKTYLWILYLISANRSPSVLYTGPFKSLFSFALSSFYWHLPHSLTSPILFLVPYSIISLLDFCCSTYITAAFQGQHHDIQHCLCFSAALSGAILLYCTINTNKASD